MINVKNFGKTQNGTDTFLYTLNNGKLEVSVTDYGATLVSVKTADTKNQIIDIILGYDTVTKYENDDKYIGATIGRCSNRIKDGIIIINEKKFQLSQNEGQNTLHGGFKGFNKKVWTTDFKKNSIKFTYVSPAGEEGFPNELKTEVSYSLNETALEIHYKAISNGDTVCALTNHSYFNLDGYKSGNILDHQVQIFADYFTRNNEQALPTGEILSVEKTPMDFRKFKPLRQDIYSNYEQVKFAKGFDNNWIINNYDRKNIIPAAKAFSKESGITLEVLTNLPGIQLYSGNFLDGAQNGKENFPIKNHSGFCLECQYFPNAFANKDFPQPVLKEGEVYDKTIIYNFGLI